MKQYLLLLLFFMSFSVVASEDCPGTVTEIMDHSNLTLCEDGMAFRLTSTGNTYLCTISAESVTLVTTAYVAGKKISPRLEPPVPGNCNSFASNYITPSYIRMHD